jgi:hypothetical protein
MVGIFDDASFLKEMLNQDADQGAEARERLDKALLPGGRFDPFIYGTVFVFLKSSYWSEEKMLIFGTVENVERSLKASLEEEREKAKGFYICLPRLMIKTLLETIAELYSPMFKYFSPISLTTNESWLQED